MYYRSKEAARITDALRGVRKRYRTLKSEAPDMTMGQLVDRAKSYLSRSAKEIKAAPGGDLRDLEKMTLSEIGQSAGRKKRRIVREASMLQDKLERKGRDLEYRGRRLVSSKSRDVKDAVSKVKSKARRIKAILKD